MQVRVLEVVPGSPSHIAGLQPEHDYLLGTAERVFKDPDILFEEVTAHLDQPMSFYVYNTQTDEVWSPLLDSACCASLAQALDGVAL